MALVCDERKSPVCFALAVLALILGGCSDDSPEGPSEKPPPAMTPSVEIGTAGGDDGLQFVPLEPGGTLYIETFGQGGTHVIFSIRCRGLSERAFINITITNLESGVQVSTPMSARPQLLSCQDEWTCERTPLLVMMGGIAEPGQDRHGLGVRVEAEAHNQAGDRAEAEIEGVLNTERL
jgi:hypothetical protein